MNKKSFVQRGLEFWFLASNKHLECTGPDATSCRVKNSQGAQFLVRTASNHKQMEEWVICSIEEADLKEKRIPVDLETTVWVRVLQNACQWFIIFIYFLFL